MEKIEPKILSPCNFSYFIYDRQYIEYYEQEIERFNNIDTSELRLTILKKLIKDNHSDGYYDGFICIDNLTFKINITYKIKDNIYIPYILFSFDNDKLIFVQNNAYITL